MATRKPAFQKGDRVRLVKFTLDPVITIEASMGLPVPKIGIEGTVIDLEENMVAVLLAGYSIEILFEPKELKLV